MRGKKRISLNINYKQQAQHSTKPFVFSIVLISNHPGKFLIQKVVPQASGESSKVKVKVRVNIHGIFSVSSASLVEVQKSDETEEPMETEQANDKDEQVQIYKF